jgi:hypothetical protein
MSLELLACQRGSIRCVKDSNLEYNFLVIYLGLRDPSLESNRFF